VIKCQFTFPVSDPRVARSLCSAILQRTGETRDSQRGTLNVSFWSLGLELNDNSLGRPATFTQLWLAAKEKYGECDQEAILDSLYNLNPKDAELVRYVPLGGGFQSVSFERRRNVPQWKDFFTQGDFRIKVLPPGRVRY
jgi:hypothetical protein